MIRYVKKAGGQVAVFASVGLILFTLQFNGFFKTLEHALLDQKFRSVEKPVSHDRIILGIIDQKSLDAFAENHNIYWPWPREIYGMVHNYLMAKEARLVVYDILFDQPDFDRDGYSGAQSDFYLEQMLGTYQNSVLSVQTVESSTGFHSPLLDDFKYKLPVLSKDNSPLYSVHNLPIPQFLQTAQSIGSVEIPAKNETLIRSVPLFFQLSDESALPSLGMAAYLANLRQPDIQIQKSQNNLKIDTLNIPLLDNGKYLINWYKKGGVKDGTFENISFYSLFEAAVEFQQTGIPRNDKYINLKEKIVFIGANAAGLSDIKSTPMSPIEPFPGVEIHATITHNLLENDFIQNTSNSLKNLIIFLIAAWLLFTIFWTHSVFNISSTIITLLIIAFTGIVLFSEYRIWFPTAEVFLSSMLFVISGYATKYVTEGAQKRAVRNAFNLYLQKELVEQIVNKPELLKLGGEKKELTVLFSDLAGFTTLSEHITPEKLVTFLNEYLSEMTNTVFQNKGTLDKYIGDAVMAFWGAPLPQDDHAFYACKCALEMEEKLKELQAKWKRQGLPTPSARYGLNSGQMVVGNLGSKDRFSYTVIGDAVNLGARLEPANKDFGTRILISESTQKKLNGRMLTREVTLLKAKGKTKPIRVYELLCTAENTEYKMLKEFTNHFEEALKYYYRKEWDLADANFRKALQIKPEDKLTLIYLEKIREFKQHPPGKNWDGSYQQINK